jgi:biotin synthase-like enzyme
LRHQLTTLKSHPEGVPINMLVRVEDTPLASMPALGRLEWCAPLRPRAS